MQSFLTIFNFIKNDKLLSYLLYKDHLLMIDGCRGIIYFFNIIVNCKRDKSLQVLVHYNATLDTLEKHWENSRQFLLMQKFK